MGEVIDFTEHYLHKLIDTHAKANNLEIANALADVLEKYVMGEVRIKLIGGLPFIIRNLQTPDSVNELDIFDEEEDTDN